MRLRRRPDRHREGGCQDPIPSISIADFPASEPPDGERDLEFQLLNKILIFVFSWNGRQRGNRIRLKGATE